MSAERHPVVRMIGIRSSSLQFNHMRISGIDEPPDGQQPGDEIVDIGMISHKMQYGLVAQSLLAFHACADPFIPVASKNRPGNLQQSETLECLYEKPGFPAGRTHIWGPSANPGFATRASSRSRSKTFRLIRLIIMVLALIPEKYITRIGMTRSRIRTSISVFFLV